MEGVLVTMLIAMVVIGLSVIRHLRRIHEEMENVLAKLSDINRSMEEVRVKIPWAN